MMDQKLTGQTTLVTAITGNHGLALAREGQRRGLPVRIYAPHGTSNLAVAAKDRLAESGVTSGPSGACGLAALQAILQVPELKPIREASGLGRQSRVLVLNTEGVFE